MNIEKMIGVYVEYCRSEMLRPKTIEAYKQGLYLFAAWLKENENVTDFEAVKDVMIRRYMLDLQNRGKYTFSADRKQEMINYPTHRRDYNQKLSNITINNYLRYIRTFFAWLLEMEYIEKTPMKKVRLLPQERPPKEYLEDYEVKRLLQVLNTDLFVEYRDKTVMMIMLDSGTRLGETLSVETEQIDLMEKSILLPAEKTKGRKTRTVFFSQKTEKELRKWLKYKERYCSSDYAFPIRSTGRPMTVSQYGTNFRKYMVRAGITKKVSPHTLRNNFAKRCLLSGMDIYTLSRILGHSSVKVTERNYLDVKDEELKEKYLEHSPINNIYHK